MGTTATFVTVVLLLFVLQQYRKSGAEHQSPVRVVRHVSATASLDDGEAVRKRRDCDLLCERYDRSRDIELCRRLREDCELPCDPDQTFLDVVYLWANGSDPLYQREQARLKANIDRHDACVAEATSSRRSREVGILRYSMRALFAHFRHVRRVFIVAPLGQVPSFLDASHPRVRMVDTRVLVPGPDPSFNSNAIQLQMHLIPTVSDPFLSMNDDFLMLKDQNYSTFVNPATNRVRYPVDHLVAADMTGCRGRIIRVAAKLLKSHFRDSRAELFVAAHQPLAVRHTVAQFIAARWQSQLASVSSHMFRDTSDPTFDSFHIWVGAHMLQGEAYSLPFDCRGAFSMTNTMKLDDVLTALQSPPPCNALALNDDMDNNAPAALLNNVIVLLDAMFPVPAPTELVDGRHAQPRGAGPPPVIDFECAYSGDTIRIATDAFTIPAVLAPFHRPAPMRSEIGINKLHYTPERLYAMFRPLDVIDIDNEVAAPALRTARARLHVTQWKAARGKSWCEVSIHMRSHAALNRTDFWLLSGQDLGMSRSRNVYTTRRLAYALGLNYVWAPEFYETNRGSSQEQAATEFTINTWGLHGNAILSPWRLEKASTVRFPNTLEVFNPPLQDLEGEKRLGGRHALFAEAAVLVAGRSDPVRVTVCVMESLIHHKLDSEHGAKVIALLRDKIASYGNELVVLGGDFWAGMCTRLGMTPALNERASLVAIDDNGVPALGPKWRDDQVCVRHFALVAPTQTYPGGYRNAATEAMETFSDHGERCYCDHDCSLLTRRRAAFVHVQLDFPK